MKYTKGTVGRVFLLKFDHKDSLVDELKIFVKKERLKTATMVFIGALLKGNLVTGPKKAVIPPCPNKTTFKDGWEVLGVGTVFTNKAEPQIHIHTAMGKNKRMLVGCVRDASQVFLVIEAVVFELVGVCATKEIDPKTGLNLLKIL
jgi:hypothetical protein